MVSGVGRWWGGLVVVLMLVSAGCSESGSEPVAEALPTALQRLESLAQHGDPQAQLALGLAYAAGTEAIQDEQAALRWLTQAAEQGLRDAQYALGNLYLLDRPFRNAERGAWWLRQAAEEGHIAAQLELGMLYAAGLGVPTDLIMAFVWTHLAAAQGSLDAREARGRIMNVLTVHQFNRALELLPDYELYVLPPDWGEPLTLPAPP